MADDEGYQRESLKNIRVGRYVLIDSIPCRVVDIETSSPGKHGAAKMRITAIGMFDGQKKSLIKPSSADIEVPIITKKKAQIVSVTNTSVQVMDSESFEVYEVPLTDEFRGKLEPGKEVEVMDAMGRKALSRIWQ
jgi:translation initiation factor 5A